MFPAAGTPEMDHALGICTGQHSAVRTPVHGMDPRPMGQSFGTGVDQIPDTNVLVIGTTGQTSTVGAPAERSDRARMGPRPGIHATLDEIEDENLPIKRGGSEASTVGAPGHRPDRSGVLFQNLYRISIRSRPDANGPVRRTGGDPAPNGTPSCTIHLVLMAEDHLLDRSTAGIPDGPGFIPGGADERVSIRTPAHRPYFLAVLFQ